jgi:Zn-finger nucleic acid-binding protein
MQCPRCGVQDVIEIHHRLPDGIEVDFFSCHKCDEKWWDRQGESIDLREVLELVRRPRS